MGAQRRADFKGTRVSREVPQANQMPMLPAIVGHLQFVAADVEGRALPAVRGFHLDQPISAGPVLARHGAKLATAEQTVTG